MKSIISMISTIHHPPKALLIEAEKRNDLTEDNWKETKETINVLPLKMWMKNGWLILQNDIAKNGALHLAILEGIHIINGDDKTRDTGSLPDILSNAFC